MLAGSNPTRKSAEVNAHVGYSQDRYTDEEVFGAVGQADVVRTMKLLGCSAIKDLDGSFVDVPPEWTARLPS